MSTFNIWEFVYSTLAASTTLQTALGATAVDKRIYPELPDRNESFPCLIIGLIASSENKVPAKTATSTFQIEVFGKISQSEIENIGSLVKLVMRYLSNESPRLFDSILTSEFNQNEDDRQLFVKYLRFDLTHRV